MPRGRFFFAACSTRSRSLYVLNLTTIVQALVPVPPVRCARSMLMACTCASGNSRAVVVALRTFFSVCSHVSPSTSETPSNRRLQCLDWFFGSRSSVPFSLSCLRNRASFLTGRQCFPWTDLLSVARLESVCTEGCSGVLSVPWLSRA